MALIGYARVSTSDGRQSTDLQEDALRAAGCEKVFIDHASGGKADRKGLEDAMQYCRQGDQLVVWRLDRLGRSLKHLIEVVNSLDARGIGFRSLTESIDTTTLGGRLIFHVFGALAEFERAIIKERVVAGLAAARARNRIGGRPRAIDKTKSNAVKAMIDQGLSATDICKSMGISRATYFRFKKEMTDAASAAAENCGQEVIVK